jgi:two-component system OmpR family sensor kinase
MLTRIETSMRDRDASHQSMQRFFADASHELRTPLASLRANADLYQQGALRQRPQVEEAMRRIALEAQRMSRLVDDMLRLARLDQHPPTRHDPVDLSTLTTERIQHAHTITPARIWHTHIDADLTVTGDEELLRRAIDNLITNVHNHTPEDTTATLTAHRHHDTAVIRVSDTGPGVPADRLPRIFDRFYRASGPTNTPGSGLGLAIVTAIATAHSGTVEATLNNPQGLHITLTLPTPPHTPSRTN